MESLLDVEFCNPTKCKCLIVQVTNKKVHVFNLQMYEKSFGGRRDR